MPRLPRVHVNGALYYVSSRSLEHTPLFRGRQDYETYLELLKEYREQFGYKLFAFALLPEELHLCLELTNETTISTIMHALNSRYTKYVKKRYGQTGHVFQQRFKSTVVEKEPYLLRMTGYIHTYPLRNGVAVHLPEYRWSSYPSYLTDGESPVGPYLEAEVGEVHEALCRDVDGWTYEQYVRETSEREWRTLGEALQQWAIGSPEFLERIKGVASQQAAEASRPDPVSPDPAQPEPAGTTPQAQPGMPRLALVGTLSVAIVALSVAGLSMLNQATLKQTVRAMEQELELPSKTTVEVTMVGNSVPIQLASFVPVDARDSRGFVRSLALNGTAWDVELQPMSDAEGLEGYTDHIRFEQDLMVSSRLSSQGFMPSGYRFTVKDEQGPRWEAMQRGSGGEVVRWQAEWDGETMHGVMIRQRAGQTLSSFNFKGTIQDGSGLAGQGTREI